MDSLEHTFISLAVIVISYAIGSSIGYARGANDGFADGAESGISAILVKLHELYGMQFKVDLKIDTEEDEEL